LISIFPCLWKLRFWSLLLSSLFGDFFTSWDWFSLKIFFWLLLTQEIIYHWVRKRVFTWFTPIWGREIFKLLKWFSILVYIILLVLVHSIELFHVISFSFSYLGCCCLISKWWWRSTEGLWFFFGVIIRREVELIKAIW
jgi:hypothetical protein